MVKVTLSLIPVIEKFRRKVNNFKLIITYCRLAQIKTTSFYAGVQHNKRIAGLALKIINYTVFFKVRRRNAFYFLEKPAERLDVFVAYFVSDFFDTLVRVA
jgi:hypothetical protein